MRSFLFVFAWLFGFVHHLHAQEGGVGFPSREAGIGLGKPDGEFNGLRLTAFDEDDSNRHSYINGASIALLWSSIYYMNGLNVAPLATFENESNGLSLGGLATLGQIHRGVSIGGLANIYRQKQVGVGLGGLFFGIGGDTLQGFFGGLGIGATPGPNANYTKVLSGMSVGLIGAEVYRADGVTITGLFTFVDTLRGLAIGAANKFHQVHGVAVGAINATNEVHGLMFGALNIVQSNRRGLRGLPLVGFAWP